VLETIPAVANGQDVARLTEYLAALSEGARGEQRDAAGRRGRGLRHDRAGDDAARVKQTVAGGKVRARRCSRRSHWETLRHDPHRMRRHARHGKGGGGTAARADPMIDMLTILVVYLLVHAADMEILPTRRTSLFRSRSRSRSRTRRPW